MAKSHINVNTQSKGFETSFKNSLSLDNGGKIENSGLLDQGTSSVQNSNNNGKQNNQIAGIQNEFLQHDKIEIASQENLDKIHILNCLNKSQPEILTSLQFLPVFDGDTKMPAGNMIDLQYFARNLMTDDVETIINDMEKDPSIFSNIQKLRSNYDKLTESLKIRLNAFGLLLKNIDELKKSFDLKNNDDNIKLEISNIRMQRSKKLLSKSKSSATVYPLGLHDSLKELMTCPLGFSEDSYSAFSNSKIISQIITDLRITLEEYSPQLLTNDINRKKDKDPFALHTKSVKNNNFDFNVKKFSERITKVQSDSAPKYDPGLFSSFVNFNKSLPSDEMSRIKILIAALSKELRFSSAISRLSNTEYDKKYDIQDNNLLTRIVGELGEKIYGDVPEKNSLSSIVRINDANENIVLPYERRIISDASQHKTYIPGASFLVDSILKSTTPPDISSINNFTDNLKNTIDDSTNTLSYLLNFDDENELLYYKTTIDFFYDAISDKIELLSDANKVDDLCAVSCALLKISQTDDALKHLLFKYVRELDGPVTTTTNITNAASDNVGSNKANDAGLKDNSSGLIADKNKDSDKKGSSFEANSIPGKDKSGQSMTELGSTTLAASIEKTIISLLKQNKKQGQVDNHDITTGTKLEFSDGEIENLLTKSIDKGNSIFFTILTIFEKLKSSAVTLSNLGPSKSVDTEKSFRNSAGNTKFTEISNDTLLLFVFEIVTCIISDFVSANFNQVYTNSSLAVLIDPVQNSSIIASLKKATKKETNKITNGIFAIIDGQIQSVHESLIREDNLLRDLIDSLKAISNTIIKSSTKIKNFFSTKNNDKFSNVLHEFFTDKTDVDIIENLSNMQLAIAWQTFRSLMISNDDSLLPDEQLFTDAQKVVLESLLKLPEFGEKGKNATILTIGMPAGMLDELQNPVFTVDKDVSIKSETADLITLSIYKREPKYADIIFKPKKFIFDVSRFFNSSYKVSNDITFEKFINNVARLTDISGKNGIGKSETLGEIKSNNEYSKISNDQKTQLFVNHVKDNFLKIYIRFLTGMSLNEYNFIMNDSLIREKNADDDVKNILTKMNENTTSHSLIEIKKDNDVKSFTDAISTGASITSIISTVANTSQSKQTKSVPVTKETNIQTANFANRKTNDKVSSTKDRINDNNKKKQFKALLNSLIFRSSDHKIRVEQPKMFERIFSVMVDPDNFEIDEIETAKTSAGKATLNSALLNDNIEEIKNDQGQLAKFIKSRSKDQGDFTFSEYFVIVSLGAL